MSESITVEKIAKAVIKMMAKDDSEWIRRIQNAADTLKEAATGFEDRKDTEMRNMIRAIVIEELPSALDLYFAE